jgi:hypothetical protein
VVHFLVGSKAVFLLDYCRWGGRANRASAVTEGPIEPPSGSKPCSVNPMEWRPGASERSEVRSFTRVPPREREISEVEGLERLRGGTTHKRSQRSRHTCLVRRRQTSSVMFALALCRHILRMKSALARSTEWGNHKFSCEESRS